MNVVDTIKLYNLKWLMLCYMNLIFQWQKLKSKKGKSWGGRGVVWVCETLAPRMALIASVLGLWREHSVFVILKVGWQPPPHCPRKIWADNMEFFLLKIMSQCLCCPELQGNVDVLVTTLTRTLPVFSISLTNLQILYFKFLLFSLECS